jgi:hypothetical protein
MKRRKYGCNHQNIFLLLQENLNSNQGPFYFKK